MADGSIAIAITVDGKDVDVASKGLDGLGKSGQTASRGIKDMVVSFGLVKVASAAMNVLKSSMDAAIDRFDTMQKFPKVMSALGFSTEESTNSINKLSDGIDGLPTKLNDVVAQTQQLTAITGDLDKSTDTVLALNNAFLASGSSAEDASRGMVQYNQMLSKGQVDMQSWRSLQETMPLGLQKTAEAMGFVGKTAQQDLYKALQSGKVTFDDFNTQLIKLGTGTGQLAELAKTNSEGISTSFSNLKNAAVKGLANVLDALNNVSKEATGNSIAKNLDSLKSAVNAAFKVMVSAIQASAPAVKVLVTVLGSLVNMASKSTPLIIGVSAAFATWKAIQAANALITNTNNLMYAAGMSGKGLSIAIKSVATAQEISSNATKADILLRQAQNGQITIGTALIGVFTGGISASTVATTLMTAAVGALKVAMTILLGPIGLIMAGVTALAAVFMAHSKRQKEAKEAAEKETKAYTDLNKAIGDNRTERNKTIKSVSSETAVNDNLINSLSEMYSKTKATKAEKKDMADIVDQLNKKYNDLNLVYNQETGYLNQSISLVREKTKAFEAQAKASAYNEAINANLKEQIQLETQSKVIKDTISKLEKEKNDAAYGQLVTINAKIKEQKETLEETQAQEKKGADEYRILKQDRISALNDATIAEQAANAAIQEANATATLSYDMLSKTQQEAMDAMKTQYQSLADKATDAYDVINTQSEISVAQMTANMQANQTAISEWATNIDALAKRGLDEGLLNRLREAGPESAAQVKALTQASDAEFQAFNETVGNAGTTATSAFKTAFDTGAKGIPENVIGMVTAAKSTLANQMASANFQQYGGNVSDGIKAGISQGTSNVKSASEALSGAVKQGVQLPLEITGSSSGVMEKTGKAVVQGAKSGIENNKSLATGAADSVAKGTVAKFDPMKGQAQTAGENVSSGLALGIDGNSGVALTAAQRLADQVSEKMRKSLEIHSPSRVMRDKVGRFIPEGVAVGIDKFSGKAFEAMDGLSNGLLRPIIPEFASGAYDIGSSRGVSQIINNTYNQSNNNAILDAVNKLANRPIVTNIDVDSTNVARATSKAMTQQQYYDERTDSRMRGVLI